MQKYQVEKESPFFNTYGGLCLIAGDDGKKYLKMEDCMGPTFFGPLTDEQIRAFDVLCSVDGWSKNYVEQI